MMQDETGVLPEETAEAEESARTPLTCYQDLAGRLELVLTDATLTEESVYAGCREAISHEIGSVLVRPSDIDLVKHWLAGSAVRVTTLTGFPGGSSTTAARLYEARDVLRRGAVELALTMNLGKLVSRKFLYLESELLQMVEHARQSQARLRAVFEVDHLQQDHVLIGVRLAKRTVVDAMELAFGAAPVDRMAGIVRYVFHHAKGKLSVAVQAPALTLHGALTVYEAGAASIATANAIGILDEWRAELLRREEQQKRRLEESAEIAAPLPPDAPRNAAADALPEVPAAGQTDAIGRLAAE